MNTPRRAATAAAAVLVLVLAGTLGACTSGSSDDPTTPTPTSSSPSTSTSPTKSPEDQAADAAIGTWKNYLAAQDKLTADPSVPLTTLADYASAPQLTQDMQSFQGFRTKGYVGGGTRRVDSATASGFSSLTDPSTNPPTYPSIHVKGCYDTVDVTLVDSSGKSVQVPDRQKYFNFDATLGNSKYPDNTAWRVVQLTQTAVASCASSS